MYQTIQSIKSNNLLSRVRAREARTRTRGSLVGAIVRKLTSAV